MDGILVIDKPAGITSHDVVSRVRRLLKTKRVGHTGTLDPFATGVMVILVGRATRLAQFLDKDEKEYEAVISFGFETDTGDRTGAPKADPPNPESELIDKVRSTDWSPLLASFQGESEQTPPMYSAKKIEGKKLYEHARQGKTVERKPVIINISDIALLGTDTNEIRIRVACSAGTYIRTLAEDVGRAVGIGAHLAELRRIRAGKFEITQAVSLDRLGELVDPGSSLRPMEIAVSHLPELVISDDRIEKTRNGLSTRVGETAFADGEQIRMRDGSGDLIAIGIYHSNENSVRPKVVLR
ncbi:tRNA pseudouridine(55) synthase TruB [soil metagenome]